MNYLISFLSLCILFSACQSTDNIKIPKTQPEWISDYLSTNAQYNTDQFLSIEAKILMDPSRHDDLQLEYLAKKEIQLFNDLEKCRNLLREKNDTLFSNTNSFFDYFIRPAWLGVKDAFDYTYVDLKAEKLYSIYRNKDESISFDTLNLIPGAYFEMFPVFKKYWKIKSSSNYEFYSCSDCTAACFSFNYQLDSIASSYAFSETLDNSLIMAIREEISKFILNE